MWNLEAGKRREGGPPLTRDDKGSWMAGVAGAGVVVVEIVVVGVVVVIVVGKGGMRGGGGISILQNAFLL